MSYCSESVWISIVFTFKVFNSNYYSGKSEYLGQISLEVKLVPLSPDSPEHRRASQSQPTSSHTPSPARGLELAARKLKPGTWTSMVHIVLVEGRDLLAMDEEGTSDPYCKFRWEVKNDCWKYRYLSQLRCLLVKFHLNKHKQDQATGIS